MVDNGENVHVVTPVVEKNKLMPISTLRVLVHPLYIAPTKKVESWEAYYEQRTAMNKYIEENFPSKNDNEVLLMMPNLRSNLDRWKEDIRQIRDAKAAYPDEPQWDDLYKNLKQSSSNPNAVIFVDNLINEENDITTVHKLLEKKGYVLEPNTHIILGGESMNACVRIVAHKLLKDPNITRISIDKKAVTTSDTLMGRDVPPELTNFAYFRQIYSDWKDFGFEENEQYLTIIKK